MEPPSIAEKNWRQPHRVFSLYFANPPLKPQQIMTRLRKPLILAALVVATGCGESATGPVALPALRHDPILFVHGYGGNGGNWQDLKALFKADGWLDQELYSYNYSFTASNATSAEEIRAQVDGIIASTGAVKVDIVAFSMGSISSRYYLRNLGGASKVEAWVSLAGPNHGTDTADNCSFTPCREIQIGSPFLAALNVGDETPGLTRYATWRSPCDLTINPDQSVPLSGATNNESACINHIEFLVHAPTYRQVRDFVD